jgi:hypothetical protein
MLMPILPLDMYVINFFGGWVRVNMLSLFHDNTHAMLFEGWPHLPKWAPRSQQNNNNNNNTGWRCYGSACLGDCAGQEIGPLSRTLAVQNHNMH